MPRRVRTVALVALAVALLAAAALVFAHWWRERERTTFEQAAAYAPDGAARLSWTDWAAVREHVGADLGPDSTGADVERLLDSAYDDDLTSTSALVGSAPVLQERFGFSPGTADWELFSQSDDGAVVIVGLADDADPDDVADHLERAGFDRPSSDGGVWVGGESLLPEIGANLTPELQYVAIDADDGLVLTSDRADYLQLVLDDLGDTELPEAVREAVAASGEPLSAVVYDGDHACSALAMSQADSDDQATGDRLVVEAGGVNPMTAFAMSAQPGGHVRVVLAFESDEQARANADSRARLAAGPAPGQGGDFTDRFTVVSAAADDVLVTLDLEPEPGAYVLSDLSSGPVLFATC